MPHPYSFFRRKSLRTIGIVGASMAVAFILGIQTAGDIQPVVKPTEAGNAVVDGDLNGNGVLDIGDARAAIEIALGYRTVTPEELAADPNHDLTVTIEDALAIIDALEHQPSQTDVQL